MVWLSPKLNNPAVNELYLHGAEGDREDSSCCPGAVHCAGGWLGGGSTLGIAFRSGQSGLQSRIHTLPPTLQSAVGSEGHQFYSNNARR